LFDLLIVLFSHLCLLNFLNYCLSFYFLWTSLSSLSLSLTFPISENRSLLWIFVFFDISIVYVIFFVIFVIIISCLFKCLTIYSYFFVPSHFLCLRIHLFLCTNLSFSLCPGLASLSMLFHNFLCIYLGWINLPKSDI